MTTQLDMNLETPSQAEPAPESAASAQNERLADAEAFVQEIRALDNGRRAVLRRNAGNALADARGCAWFYGLASRHGLWSAGALFLVATVMSDNRAARLPRAKGDLGKSLRQLAAGGGGSGVERRLRSLLDADFDPNSGDGSLSHHLRQLVMRLLAAHISIDWAQLLTDVRSWNSPKHFVQRNWAISFYAEGKEKQSAAVADTNAELNGEAEIQE